MGVSSRRIPLTWATALDQEQGGRFVKGEGDRALLFRARDGDEKACRELLERHGQRLLSVVIATQGDPAMAEDVVQETFIRAIREADKLREEASMFPWLVKIALRAGIDYRRKVRREMIVLRYFASFSTHELALVFQKSEAAIRKDLQRARGRTRKLLAHMFGGRNE